MDEGMHGGDNEVLKNNVGCGSFFVFFSSDGGFYLCASLVVPFCGKKASHVRVCRK